MSGGRTPDRRAVPLPALLGLAVLIAAAVFGSRPLISYKALGLGATTFEIGVIASAFAVFAIAASIPIGRLVDRVGERGIIVVGALVVGVGCALALLADSTVVLALSQSALGLGQLMVVVASHAVLAYRGSVAGRDQRIGIYTSAVSIGHAAGPGAAGVLADPAVTRNGQELFFVLAVIAAASAAALALRLPPGIDRSAEPANDRRDPASLRRTLERVEMRQALIGSIAALAAVDLLIAYLPVFGTEHGLPPAVVGMMLAALGLAALASRLFMGRLVRAVGHVRLLTFALLAPAVLIPVLTVAPTHLLLVAIMAGVGAALGLAQPMTLALVARAAQPGGQGLAMGMRLAGNRLGQLSIPVVVGATAGQAGATGILYAVGAILGLATATLLVGRAPSPPEHASVDEAAS